MELLLSVLFTIKASFTAKCFLLNVTDSNVAAYRKWQKETNIPPFLLLLHLAAWTIKYAESYPAEIIVLLVITESAHLARMIPRKRCVSLISTIRIAKAN